MFARHNFVYKRSQNGAHHNIVARALVPSQLDTNGNGNGKTPDIASIASSLANDNPKTTNPVTPPFTPVATSQTPNTPTSSPLQNTPSSSAPALVPTSSPSSSALKLTSSPSSSATSPAIHSSISTVSTPSIVAPATTHTVSVFSQAATGLSFAPVSTSSPSTTASPTSSSGINTGSIVGGIAGTLVGVAVLGFLLMWCMRRQRNRDLDDFDAQAFKRQSVMLVDDPVEPPQSYNPRPPTMIERHNASPALAAQGGYSGQNFYGGYGGVQQPYAPPETVQSAGSPPQAYGALAMGYSGHSDQQPIARQPSNVGYAVHDSRQQLARQPSNAQYLTRQPSSPAAFSPPAAPPTSFDPNAHYIDLDRSSISPYQAAQYADISRQLGTTNPTGRAPHRSHDLPADPLPSPFDDPVEAAESTAVPHAISSRPSEPAVASLAVANAAPQPQGKAAEPHQRPATVYDEGDAYGGI